MPTNPGRSGPSAGGVQEWTFRRYIERYEDFKGLIDRRLTQVSRRQAPLDELTRLETLYRERFDDWKLKHFYSFYRRHHGGERSYSWVKNRPQSAGLVKRAKGRHRKRRVHPSGRRPLWVAGCYWDLIVTMDDATSEHDSMFFIEEEGSASRFRGVRETISAQELFCSLTTDRGSHYGYNPP